MATKSDFKAAEEIKAILHDRDKTEQERIIRWVTESLGLVVPLSTSSGMPPAVASTSPQANTQPPGGQGPRSKNIKTFVIEKKPKSDVQFAAVTAYFYRFECLEAERKELITAKDLDDAGRQARGYSFKDALKTLNNAVGGGYFDRAGRGAFKLNAVGENLVAMTLPSAGLEGGGGKPRRVKSKARGAKRKAK